MKSKVLSIFIILSFILGCETETPKIEEGTYTGTFTVFYSSGIESGTTTIVLKDSEYSCSGNSDRIPAGGSGTYSSENGKITFVDKNFWTAEFDWNLILSGEYNYSIDGNELLITAEKSDIGRYEYRLERQ